MSVPQVWRRRTLSRAKRPSESDEPKLFPSTVSEDTPEPSVAPAAPTGSSSIRFRPRMYLNTRVTRPSHLRTMSLATALGATPIHGSKPGDELDEKAQLQEQSANETGARRASVLFPVQEHGHKSHVSEKATSPVERARSRTRKMSLAMSAAVRSASMHLHTDHIASFQISPPTSPTKADANPEHAFAGVIPHLTEPKASAADSVATKVHVQSPDSVAEGNVLAPSDEQKPTPSALTAATAPAAGGADEQETTHPSLMEDAAPAASGPAEPEPARPSSTVDATPAVDEADEEETTRPSLTVNTAPVFGGIAFPTKKVALAAPGDADGPFHQGSAEKKDGMESRGAANQFGSPPSSLHPLDSPRPSMSISSRRVRVWSITSGRSQPPHHSLLSSPTKAKPSLGAEVIAAAPTVGLQIGDIGGEFAMPSNHHAATTSVSAVASYEGKRRARLSSMASSDARSGIHSPPLRAASLAGSPRQSAAPLPDTSVGTGGFSLPLVRFHKKNTRLSMFQWGNASETESGELWFVDGRVIYYSVFGKTSQASPLLYIHDLLEAEVPTGVLPEPLRRVLDTVSQQVVLITTPRSSKKNLWPNPKELEALRTKLGIAQWSAVATTGTGVVPALTYVHAFSQAAKTLVAYDINLGRPSTHDLAVASVSSGDAWAKVRDALSLLPIEEATITEKEYQTVLEATASQLQSVTDETRLAQLGLARAWNAWQRAQGLVLNVSSDEETLSSAAHSVDVLTHLPAVSIDLTPIPVTLIQARHDMICTARTLASVKGTVTIIDGAARGSHLTVEAFTRALLDQLTGSGSEDTAKTHTSVDVSEPHE